MIQAIIPAAASLAGSLITNAVNTRNIENANARNEALQREQWSRDDTAYQRVVQDMQKAGLNPLSGVNPQSSPLSVQNEAAQVENPLAALPAIIQAQTQLNLQEKGLALQAIRSGVNPNALDNFADNDLLNDFKRMIKYQADEMEKAAGSRNSRNTGVVGKVIGDVRDNLPLEVNTVVDNVLDGAGKVLKRSTDNAQKAINDVKPVVKSAVKKGSKLVEDAKTFNKKVKTWFKNKFGKKN